MGGTKADGDSEKEGTDLHEHSTDKMRIKQKIGKH